MYCVSHLFRARSKIPVGLACQARNAGEWRLQIDAETSLSIWKAGHGAHPSINEPNIWHQTTAHQALCCFSCHLCGLLGSLRCTVRALEAKASQQAPSKVSTIANGAKEPVVCNWNGRSGAVIQANVVILQSIEDDGTVPCKLAGVLSGIDTCIHRNKHEQLASVLEGRRFKVSRSCVLELCQGINTLDGESRIVSGAQQQLPLTHQGDHPRMSLQIERRMQFWRRCFH